MSTKAAHAVAFMPDNVLSLSPDQPAAEAAERDRETQLLLRVRDDGDRGAFSTLFDEFSPRLRSYARRQGADVQSAESVVQDVMVTLWTRAMLFDPNKASARTWLFTLLRNRLIDLYRSDERRRRGMESLAQDTSIEDGDTAESELAGSRMADFINELPEEQARIVVMGFVEGKSHREIANELEIPTGTVKSRTRLALQRLRKRLEVMN